jgi:hypothetical protein
MRSQWKIMIPPLLCGLLAALCLALAPYRLQSDPRSIKPINRLVIAVVSVAAMLELHQSFTQRPRGLIERRAVQVGVISHSAFVVPYSPHLWAACMLLSLLLIGQSFELMALGSILLPIEPAIARHAQAAGGIALVPAVLAFLFSVRRFFDHSHGLMLFSEGVTLRSGLVRWYVPWEVIEEVRPVTLKIIAGRGPLVLGLRVTDSTRMQLPRWLRWSSKRLGTKTGWPCLWPLFGCTLTVREVTFLLNSYRLHPEEQPKIGAEVELAEVRKALSRISDEPIQGQPRSGHFWL